MYYPVVGVGGIETIKVCLVTVFIPPASHVGLSAMDTQGVWVFVFRGERTAVVIFHGITWKKKE